MPSATGQTTNPDLPPFPDQSTLSLLPDVYLLLSRIALLQQQQSNGAATSPTNGAQATPNPLNLTPLDIKELTAAIYPLKQKIQKARETITGMIDVERSVGEQQAEIRSLEAKVHALKDRLALLGDIAREGTKQEDEVMAGVEAES
ncbi:uncharacterized protein HMPREF1541_09205 [Cyphellophora europaea CBS 101466]|uniref:Mediator of RNA polymerase II transcription subunit 9 n=1 Tax=Cyphellophora europaea (strain CBS 101466) TaxID=1220924 RepID=W2SBU4_CYPE1|nr:uncharacterized protein HMPREF1541_09205 [Cyphellophora europaea CBS 101466]ETN45374.1 hypothetical protein HMPREF1541_09205 [Cyphellophora europaea CBS 101466]